MIFVDVAWDEIKRMALLYQLKGRTWTSPVQKRTYKVDAITEKTIKVSRQSGGQITVLGKRNTERMTDLLNQNNGRVKRRNLDYTVAVETAIVELHPLLELKGDCIEEQTLRNPVSADAGFKGKAALKKQFYARNARYGQPALRNNLLVAYRGRCCVSDTGP